MLEYSLGLGNSVSEVQTALKKYMESNKDLPAVIISEYANNRIKSRNLTAAVPDLSKLALKSPLFLYEDLLAVDQNMIGLKFSEALTSAKDAAARIETIDNALKMNHAELKEIFALAEDNILLKLNRFKEFSNAFVAHSAKYPNCKELYQLNFEAAMSNGSEIDIEEYLSDVCKKFPDWSWTLNTKAWLLYSQPPLTESKLLQTIKLLEESIKTDKSAGNTARIRLASILWVHKG